MKIEIKRLELTNFKCFRHKEITFDSDITTIRGRNGVGKTTIADAILWCLFGKNSQGQSTFDLKTHDETGNPIPNLDHSVEMQLDVMGERDGYVIAKHVNLKRTLKETWIKKRGSEEQVFKNNTTEYLINGEVITAKDYEKYISDLVSEDIFRAITNPSYFPSLKWQMQREFLTKMAGSIEPECIANDDDLAELVRLLDTSNEDIIAYRKHLSYKIKGIKDKLEKIPVRLEEQNKALPEKLDWAGLNTLLEHTSAELKKVEEKIISIKSGNGGEILRSQIRSELKVIQGQIDGIEDEERRLFKIRQAEHDGRINVASRKFNESVGNQRLMESTIEADKRIISRCEDCIKDCDKELQKLRDNWPNRKFEVDSSASYCPTCGQPLPDELAADRIKSMRENFNKALEEEKQTLREKAAKVKQTKEDAEGELQASKDKLKSDTEALAEIKEFINSIFSEKAKIEKEHVVSLEQALAETAQYQELLNSKAEAQKKLDSVCDSEDDRSQLVELEEKKSRYEVEISSYQAQLATRHQYYRIINLIEDINKEQKELVAQLSELERREDVARRYQDRQNAILESRINEHFSLVQWKMFRTVNNGGDPYDEPFCECYVDGVAYHDGLNQAARLNAGLDIIAALCKHYNVYAPICIDNSESNLNILTTTSQQIRLQVCDSDLQVV